MTTIRLSFAPVLLVLLAGTAVADEACPRTPSWGQVPNVWDLAPAEVCGGTPCAVTQMRARSDGRWAGAAQVPLSSGDAGGRVRFLEGTDSALYVSLEIETTAADREVFWFGWAPSSATDAANAWLLEVSVRPDPNVSNPEMQEINQKVIGCDAPSCPAGETCTQTACAPHPLVSYRLLHGIAGNSVFRWDGAAFDQTVQATWLSASAGPGSRAWHGPLYTGTSGPPTAATVVLRIPNTVFGSATATDQKVWVAAAACAFLGTGPSNCASQGNWPSAGEVTESTPNNYSVPALADWGILHRTNPASCTGQPTLASAGVQNGATATTAYDPSAAFTWPQRMYLDNNGNPDDDPLNYFAARVTMPLTPTAGKYRARFYTADWGSQIGNLNVSQWTEIGQVTNPGVAISGTEHVVLRWPPQNMSNADHKKLACKYSDCDATVPGCPFPKGVMPDPCAGIDQARTHHPHQCTQVKLEGMGTSSYQFMQDSMIFNTDFVGASVFWRVATISTAGIRDTQPPLAPAPPDGRDIYIHVKAANLPAQTTGLPVEATLARLEGMVGKMGKPPSNALASPLVPFSKALRERLGSGNDNIPDKARQALVIGQIRALPLSVVRQVAPTLEFDVYYDARRVMDTFDGKKSLWLAPMTSFRYVVEHIGDVQGWEWAIDGAQPLGHDWYHIKIPDGGKHLIRTRVQAVETARMQPGNPVWPPGSTWINAPATPSTVHVKVTKKRGCSVGDDSGSGVVLVLVLVALTRRRRR